jgi:aryl-alcohol dehydrogenase-like predicted oxidoreductase
MTFGTEWGWGVEEAQARRVFDAYVDRGGNFIDTAVNYTNGTSERLVGKFAKEKRERVVIATKFTMLRCPDAPNSGGNHRLNMVRSVEASLKQLETDRVDLLYLHRWDFTTSPDEVMRGLDDVVRSGKVVYVGISNAPAWRVAEMQTLASLRGWSPLVALTVEYNLVQRTAEHELLPMARAMGLGVVPWSALAGGLLTGRYAGNEPESPGAPDAPFGSRLDFLKSRGVINDRSLSIVEAVRSVAREIGASPSQVALAWTLVNPAVASSIVGADTPEQLEENLRGLEISLDDAMLGRLDAASRPSPIFPYSVLEQPSSRKLVFGELHVEGFTD